MRCYGACTNMVLRTLSLTLTLTLTLVSSGRKLLINMQKCEHCLNHLLPPRKDNDIEL